MSKLSKMTEEEKYKYLARNIRSVCFKFGRREYIIENEEDLDAAIFQDELDREEYREAEKKFRESEDE